MYPLSLKIKSYIQPFERELAFLEIEKLTNSRPEPLDDSPNENAIFYTVKSSVSAQLLAERTAYWEVVGRNNEFFTTRQVQREATVSIVRNGNKLSEIVEQYSAKHNSIKMPNRRCLRYGSHGLHEYRGKFFPQLVRSLLNIATLPDTAVVGDPMCGSGTTAVEAVLAGHTAQVLDMNPLSVFMTRTKCDVLTVKPRYLHSAFSKLSEKLNNSRPDKKLPYTRDLSDKDQEYLGKWLSRDVLSALDCISVAISELRSPSLRNFYKLSQSNILRKVSWQKEADLRVRRDMSKCVSFDEVVKSFLLEAERNAKYMAAFLVRESGPIGTCMSYEGDARRVASIWNNECDVVITSPPYATALPYLDTDRLSLIYLDLLPRSGHRAKDQLMIGNREISKRSRSELWDSFERRDTLIPDEGIRVIREIYARNIKDPNTGFRRRNLPSLLYQYLCDMKATIRSLRACVKDGSDVFIVVGDNQTTAGGKKIRIPTIRLLQQIAECEGFTTMDMLPMEMLKNREIHRRNATPSESIIWIRKEHNQ